MSPFLEGFLQGLLDERYAANNRKAGRSRWKVLGCAQVTPGDVKYDEYGTESQRRWHIKNGD